MTRQFYDCNYCNFPNWKGLWFVIVSMLVIQLSSCIHDPFLVEEPPITDTIPGECDTAKLYFNRDILPIFRNNCATSGCHDAATAENGYVFTDYAKIISKGFEAGKPSNSEVYEVIATKKADDIMPPLPFNALTEGQISQINRWISEGLKNDTCSIVAVACDTSFVSYRNTIQPIFTNNCIGCHGPITNYSGIRLDNYTGTKNALNTGRLLGALQWENGFIKMPLDLPQLVGCDLKKIEIWVRNGALDN